MLTVRILPELERKVLFTFQDCSGRVSRYLMRSERVFTLDRMPSLCLNSSRSVMSVIRPAGGWIDEVSFLRNFFRNMVFGFGGCSVGVRLLIGYASVKTSKILQG